MVSIPESSTSESSSPPELTDPNGSSGHIRKRALTARQERKLVEYIEDSFLDVMRNYKKRNHPSSTLPTLPSYLRATHTLLSLILQIPPVAQQASLRTALLLRFTNETLSAISYYSLPALGQGTAEEQPGAETLHELLAWLDELDRGWCAVLRAQAWDVTAHEGVDVELDVPLSQASTHNANADDTGSEMDTRADDSYSPAMLGPANAVSQTDRARLRSLLLAGSAALEEWLEGIQLPTSTSSTSSTNLRANVVDSETNPDIESGAETERPDLESTLEHLGLQQAFDDLFSRTLSGMGELAGEVLSAGDELEME